MLDFYQHLPEHINPIVMSIGFFKIRWYAVMYLIAFTVVYSLLMYRLKRGENKNNNFQFSIFNFQTNPKSQFLNFKLIENLFLYTIIGLLIGARLGYVLFYNFSYYFHNPLEIFLPVQANCQLSIANCLSYTGIHGMSYYGGLVGVIVASLIFARKYKINFWRLADFVVPAIPAGYFFGRVGNFINGELYGRVTDKWWGMYFPADSLVLRHPSQLYEAFLEGFILFIILWFLRNKSIVKGQMLIVYLFGYGFFRFFVEFFREPDPLRLGSLTEASPQIGLFFNALSLGQIFSLIMIFMAGALFLIAKRKGKGYNEI
jgi:phosphatidylglycerol---prolipoprotein diacylglyceryl transferase